MPGAPYGGFTLQLEVTPDKTGDLDMSIEWIGTEDGESGTIELSGVINVADSKDHDSNHPNQGFHFSFLTSVCYDAVGKPHLGSQLN